MTSETIYACAFICTPLSAGLGILAWKEWREKRHAQDEHARSLQITLDLTVAMRDALANNKELADMVKLDREIMQTAAFNLDAAESERSLMRTQLDDALAEIRRLKTQSQAKEICKIG